MTLVFNKEKYDDKEEDDDKDDSEDDPRMYERVDAKACIIYPENSPKEVWDSVISIILLLTCVLTPM